MNLLIYIIILGSKYYLNKGKKIMKYENQS
jgi:hypothetical protein